MNLKSIVSSELSLQCDSGNIQLPSSSDFVYRVTDVKIPEELRKYVFPSSDDASTVGISNTVWTPSWELMKNHLVYLLETIGNWSKERFTLSISYLRGSCSSRIFVILENQKGTLRYPVADLICFDQVHIKKDIGKIVQSGIEPSTVEVSLRNTKLNMLVTLTLTLIPTIPSAPLSVSSPKKVSCNALVKICPLSRLKLFSFAIRAILPGNFESFFFHTTSLLSFNEYLRNIASSRDFILRKVDILRIGDSPIGDLTV